MPARRNNCVCGHPRGSHESVTVSVPVARDPNREYPYEVNNRIWIKGRLRDAPQLFEREHCSGDCGCAEFLEDDGVQPAPESDIDDLAGWWAQWCGVT